jgi:hypothetical protein
VFNPAWLRQNLSMFQLMTGNLASRMIKHHEASAGCALINCANVSSHNSFFLRMRFIADFQLPIVDCV